MKNILFVAGLFMMILFSEKSTAQGNNKSAFNYRASSPGIKAKPAPAKIPKTKSPGVNTSALQGFIGSPGRNAHYQGEYKGG